MIERFRIWLLDFDGVLVDSYTCLPRVYEKIAYEIGLHENDVQKFVELCMKEEEKMEKREQYDRKNALINVLREMNVKYETLDIDYLIELYWKERIKGSFLIDGVIETLNYLYRISTLVVVCGSDFWKDMKRQRINASGLSKFFREIIIIGEDFPDFASAINYLRDKYFVRPDNMIIVNDRTSVICKTKKTGIITARVKSHSFLEKLFENNCNPDFKADNLHELVLRMLTFNSFKCEI